MSQQPLDYFQRGQQLQSEGKINEAITEIKKSIELSQEQSSWFLAHLAGLVAEQGRFSEAITINQKTCLLSDWYLCKVKNYHFMKQGWFAVRIFQWLPHVRHLANAPSINALEIGSFEGMSACWMLDNILTSPSSKLTCIDVQFQDVFDENLEKTGVSDKVTKLVGRSQELLSSLPTNSYDLIYIDGDHTAASVIWDAFFCWSLAKVGGVIIFDDYQFRRELSYTNQTPKIAIDLFLHLFEDKVSILSKKYQVIVKKTCDNINFNLLSFCDSANALLAKYPSNTQIDQSSVASELSRLITDLKYDKGTLDESKQDVTVA